jgi:HAE1 family hydrophobic/amphiphilic exporter-1
VDSERLAAYQISILEIREALNRQNAEVPGGRVDEGQRERALRTLGRVSESADFNDLVIKSVEGQPLRLSDIGSVKDTTKEVRTLARMNGQPAVVMQIQRQSGENTVAVINAIKERLPRCRELLPDDVGVTVIQDQSRYILEALHEIQRHLISGSILACLTVLLFMKSWRSTLVASVAIPASIIATFAFMKWFDFTLNNVTMLALVLMVGVVIDDAIVVLENIFHCIEEKGLSPKEASIQGTQEIGLAVLATTISLVIVFLPVSFLSSVTGRMLFEFGVTASIAILISMIISFSLTPMMCSKLLRESKDQVTTNHGRQPRSRRGLYGIIESIYLWTLNQALRMRWLTLTLVIAVIAANVPLLDLVKRDYVPLNVDESEFEVRVEARQGANMEAMRETIDLVEDKLQKIDGIETALTTLGTRSGGDINRASIFVRLVDSKKRTFSISRLWQNLLAGTPEKAWEGNYTQREKMSEVRSKLNTISDVKISVRNLTSLRQGAPVDIDMAITGPDPKKLLEFSEKLKKRAEEIPGIVDVYATLEIDNPELLVSIDRERAATLGVDVREIAETLRVAVGGDDRVSRFFDSTAGDAYDVELRLVGMDRNDVPSISQLYVRSSGRPQITGMDERVNNSDTTSNRSELIRIDNCVDFTFATSASRIDRLSRQRMVAVRGNLDSGYALADRIDALHEAVEEIGLPIGFNVEVLGGGRELETTVNDFLWMFVLSIIFMYIVLAAQYEHLVYPLVILMSLPLAVPFGLISLYWGEETLNLYSALGILVLFGVVKKAAILQVDQTNVLRRGGMDRHRAIMQANRDRLRPILMTTLSFVAGLLPLLIATGPGAEERRSIAILAVGGQTLSLALTLLAIPVIYTFLDDLSEIPKRLKSKSSPAT